MKKVELVDELVGIVCSFRQSTQISNQTDVVGLRVELFFESWILYDWETMAQGECFTQNLMIWFQFSVLNVFYVLQDELDA
jgi:hypothetical protein